MRFTVRQLAAVRERQRWLAGSADSLMRRLRRECEAAVAEARSRGVQPNIVCLGEKQADAIAAIMEERMEAGPAKYLRGLRIVWVNSPDYLAAFEERPCCWA